LETAVPIHNEDISFQIPTKQLTVHYNCICSHWKLIAQYITTKCAGNCTL